MKHFVRLKFSCIFLLLIIHSVSMNAQCPVGFTRDTLNWEYRDFLPNTGSYVSPTAYITLAQSQTQRHTFGTQRVTITHNYSGTRDPGDNTTHTGETGTYGNGADVQLIGNGAITFTFQNPVQSVRFSVQDIDRNQRVNISAATNVVLSTLGGTILSLTNNNTTNARASASNTNVSNNSTAGTVNVNIAGPITSFTLTITNTSTGSGEDGSFWISDVSACSAGTFANNYYNISQPFTGQPAYVLATRNDSVYYINIANGKSKFLFKDNNHDRLNSLAYDPYRHMVYYTWSLSGPGGAVSSTDYILRRYDYDMDTVGIVSNDVRTLGIPLYDQSIESGAAAFYDGSLYIGIEGGTGITDRESTIWKLDFTGAAYTPVPGASQAFAIRSDRHDWADIGINNGMLYDFDGRSGDEDFYHCNLLTGATVHYVNSPSSLIPRQVGVDWTGMLYNIGSPNAIAAATIVPYNNNGTVNTPQEYPVTFSGVAELGSWGDAAEAFKPKLDYGDAPASYDPGIEPGMHERNDSIRLGTLRPSIEWVKKTSADATGDGAEEDGVTGLQLINRGLSNFVVPVRVYNNTGRPARLYGWVDADGDGLYETSERTLLNVVSSAAVQNLNISWIGIYCSLPTYSTTFMRLRLATTDWAGVTSNPTGYADNGEIEDYRVEVTIVLPDQHVDLKAQKVNAKTVDLVWSVSDENGIDKYELQRSSNGSTWETINERLSQGQINATTYSYLDNDPYSPASYYRVKVYKNSGAILYSEIKRIDFGVKSSIRLSPNPANNIAKLNIQSANIVKAQVSMFDYTGQLILDQTVKLVKGPNNIALPIVQKLSNGVYKVRVQLDGEILVATLVVIK